MTLPPNVHVIAIDEDVYKAQRERQKSWNWHNVLTKYNTSGSSAFLQPLRLVTTSTSTGHLYFAQLPNGLLWRAKKSKFSAEEIDEK